MIRRRTFLTYLALSLVGFLFIVIIAIDNVNTMQNDLIDRFIIGHILVSCFIFGMSLAIRPNWRQSLLKEDEQNKTVHRGHAHHQDCAGHKNHTIYINNKKYCTSCFGLALGCLLGIVISYQYIGFWANPTIDDIKIMMSLGFLMIGGGGIGSAVPHLKGRFWRVMSNFLFPVGFFLVIVGMFELTASYIYAVITITICFLWLDTRIQVSRWRHHRICEECSQVCESR